MTKLEEHLNAASEELEAAIEELQKEKEKPKKDSFEHNGWLEAAKQDLKRENYNIERLKTDIEKKMRSQ